MIISKGMSILKEILGMFMLSPTGIQITITDTRRVSSFLFFHLADDFFLVRFLMVINPQTDSSIFIQEEEYIVSGEFRLPADRYHFGSPIGHFAQ
jgi:hypothetical protein